MHSIASQSTHEYMQLHRLSSESRTREFECAGAFSLLRLSLPVITGGMDSQVIVWETNRCRTIAEFSTLGAASFLTVVFFFFVTYGRYGRAGSDGGINPPFVHALSCNATGTHLAAALGNSQVELFLIWMPASWFFAFFLIHLSDCHLRLAIEKRALSSARPHVSCLSRVCQILCVCVCFAPPPFSQCA